jgi:hypothetical protein
VDMPQLICLAIERHLSSYQFLVIVDTVAITP